MYFLKSEMITRYSEKLASSKERLSQLTLPTGDGKYTLSAATYVCSAPVSRDYPQKGEFSRFSFGGRSPLGRLERVGRRPRTNRYVNSKGRQTWEIRVAHFSGATSMLFTECLIFAYQHTHISTYVPGKGCHVCVCFR